MALFALKDETKFQVGDVVRVHMLDQFARRREAVFEGYVLGIRGREENKSFLVRRIGVAGVGIERIFPLASPLITKIEVKQRLGEGARRAKLYFLRGQPKSSFEEIARRAVGRTKAKKLEAKSTTFAKSSKRRKVSKKSSKN